MNFENILKNSLRYPLLDYKNWLILGVLIVIASLSQIIKAFGIYNIMVDTVLAIVSVVLFVIIGGYSLSVLKTSINALEEVPDFNFVNNFFDGIKMIIVSILYFIIPSFITLFVAFITGVFSSAMKLVPYLANETSLVNASQNPLTLIPQSVLMNFIGSIAITVIVALILFIIFTFLQYMGLCRLAKHNSFSQALNIVEAARDIGRIGVLKFIAFAIVIFIITVIMGIIISLIAAIPYIGLIIASLIGYSYLLLFNYRALGLLYSSVE